MEYWPNIRGWSALAACSAACALLPHAAQAQAIPSQANFIPPTPAPLTVRGEISQTFEYDSNPLLLTGGAEPVFGSVTSPEFVISGATPVLRVNLDTRLDINQFDHSDFSSNDVHTTAKASATGETSYFNLTTNFDYDTTRTSELETSGVNVAGVRHTGITVTPSAGVGLTPVDFLTLDGTFQQTTYSDTALFTDFQDFSLNPGYRHIFSETDAGLVIINAGYYRTTAGFVASDDTVGGGVGWVHQFSDRLTATAVVGGEWTRSSSQTNFFGISQAVTESTISYFYNAQIQYTGNLDVFSLTGSRGLLPEGIGAETQQTSVRLSETHSFAPRFRVDVTVSDQNNDYSGTSFSSAASFLGGTGNYLEAGTDLVYRLTDTLSVAASYRFRTKSFVGSTLNAGSDTALLRITFNPHDFVL